MSLLVSLAMSVAATLTAPSVDRNVTFVSSYASYRVIAVEQCRSGRCRTTATVEMFNPADADELICSSETIAFPSAPVLASRWEMVSGSPVLYVRVRTRNGAASAEAAFQPYPDCSSSLAVARPGP